MIFQGEEAFPEDIDDVWGALHDTNVLTKAVPGCRSMTAVGNDSYLVALSLGVAAVKGDYEGKIKVTDDKPPSHYLIEGEGTGAPGFVKLRMECWLERHESGTLLKWKCDATVGGVIASIGGRVLSGISKFMAKQFFQVFRVELAARTRADGVAGRGESGGAAVNRGSSGQMGSAKKGPIGFLWSLWQRLRAMLSSKYS